MQIPSGQGNSEWLRFACCAGRAGAVPDQASCCSLARDSAGMPREASQPMLYDSRHTTC